MEAPLFILLMAIFILPLLIYSFKVLPHEHWQILMTIPLKKLENGKWQGVNLTWYGLIAASANTFGILLFFYLLFTLSIPIQGVAIAGLTALTLGVTGSKIMAKIIEKKKNTFSVAGGSFVGLTLTPFALILFNFTLSTHLGFTLPVITVMAAISISYAFGEAIGRLACLSFGCCYGKPLHLLSPRWQNFFKNISITFYGKTKKITYASNLEGVPVIPIQIITSLINFLIGTIALYAFLENHYAIAFFIAASATHLWRVIAEFFRADYRGQLTFSSYQRLCLLAPIIVLLIIYFSKSSPEGYPINYFVGLQSLINPYLILLLQLIWLSIFIYMGRSKVTGSTMEFHVNHHEI